MKYVPPEDRGLLYDLWEDGALPIALAWIVGICGVILAGGFSVILVIILGKMFGAW